MTKKKRSRKKKKKGNTLRYLTVLLVVLAVAWLGVFFYNNRSFRMSELLPFFEKVQPGAGSWTATLCFGDESGEFLLKEHRIVTSRDTIEARAEALLRELLAGPHMEATRTLPDKVQLRGVAFRNGILTADFTEELKTGHPGGSSAEILTVYSIVNTLAMNIDEIKKVKIHINGREIDNIAGHIDCRQPIAPKKALVH